ncbi:hypothetical protein TYRP_001298 [Tyrophagus putrescentiae]|nr:hypothetical protein TYRP_001298 [Tyrophagus putrescentiae]
MATPENTGTTTETADTRTLMSFAKPSTDFIYLDTPCEATTAALCMHDLSASTEPPPPPPHCTVRRLERL